jgi:hypothetical protein
VFTGLEREGRHTLTFDVLRANAPFNSLSGLSRSSHIDYPVLFNAQSVVIYEKFLEFG